MRATLCLLALTLPLLCAAQDIWRCGPEGSSYSSMSCADGQRMEPAVPRPAGDLAEARQRATAERQQAQTLQRENLAREAAARGNGLTGFAAPPSVPPLKPAKVVQAGHPKQARGRPAEAAGTWRAVVPASRRAPG
jgi:hypothetical protein